MAMSVVYGNFCGMIVHENRGGTQRDYMPDPLGSTAALLDNTQTKTDTWEYWPYGEVASRTGTNVTPFTFCGIWGYFKDLLDRLLYVRFRFFKPVHSRWLTVDKLLAEYEPYQYASCSPGMFVDFLGLESCNPGDTRTVLDNEWFRWLGQRSCGSLSRTVSSDLTINIDGKIISVGLGYSVGDTVTCDCIYERGRRTTRYRIDACRCHKEFIRICGSVTVCGWVPKGYYQVSKDCHRKIISCPWPNGEYVIENTCFGDDDSNELYK